MATSFLDKATYAGRKGQAELEQLSGIFSVVGGWAKSSGMDVDGTLGFIEQLSLIEKQPEKLGTLAESTLRVFTNQKYKEKVSDGLGIDYYNKDGSSRDAYAVLDDVAKKYKLQRNDKQRHAMIGDIFGEMDKDTQRGIMQLLSGDNLAQMRTLRSDIKNKSSGTIEKGLPNAIDNSIDQVSRFKGAMRETLDGVALPINKAVSSAIKFALDPTDKGGMGLGGMELLLGGSALIGGGLLASKAFKGKGGIGGGLISGLAVGKVLESSMGVPSVYVVNMPATIGGIPGIGADKKTPGGKGNKTHRSPSLKTPGSNVTVSKVNVKPPKLNILDNLGNTFQNLNKSGWRANAARSVKFLGPVSIVVSGGFAINDLVENGFSNFMGWPKNQEQREQRLTSGDEAISKFMSMLGFDTASKTSAIEKQVSPRAQVTIKIEQDGRAIAKDINATDMDLEVQGASMMMP